MDDDDLVWRWLAGEEPKPHEEVHGAWERAWGCEWCRAMAECEMCDYDWWEDWSMQIFSPDEMDVLILWVSMRVLTGKDQKHIEALHRLWKDARYMWEGLGDDRYDRDERLAFVLYHSGKRL